MKTIYTHKPEVKQLIAERTFTAPKSKVWKYYTTAEFLDKWWAPAPYQAVTTSLDFVPGGKWLYTMKGPEGDAHHCINHYKTINAEDSFTAEDSFADADWNIDESLPGTHWTVTFEEADGVTKLTVVLDLKSEADLEKLIEMGMKEGFDMGLNQLEALLAVE